MATSAPEPGAQEQWPHQPYGSGPIQDPVPAELQQQRATSPYGSPAPQQVAPYETFATVRPGLSGISLSINRPGTGAGLARVRVQIDDRIVPADDGDAFVTVPPGRHTVSIHRAGTKDTQSIEVDVPPGRAAPVYYSMPFWIAANGALGLQPVKTPGVGSFWVFVIALVGGVLLFVTIMLVAIATV